LPQGPCRKDLAARTIGTLSDRASLRDVARPRPNGTFSHRPCRGLVQNRSFSRGPSPTGPCRRDLAIAFRIARLFGTRQARTRPTLGVSAHRVAEADLYFHRQHAMWPDLDRAWSLTLHLHVAVERARTPACYCHSASVLGALARDRMFHLQGIVASTGSDS